MVVAAQKSSQTVVVVQSMYQLHITGLILVLELGVIVLQSKIYYDDNGLQFSLLTRCHIIKSIFW